MPISPITSPRALSESPRYLTLTALCRDARVHRSVILRLLAAGRLVPDARVYTSEGEKLLFLPIRTVDVLRQLLPKKAAADAGSLFPPPGADAPPDAA